ncbi:MAG TPA: hypothetical protein VIQ23_04190 [Hanamia sp.]|jgi:hypothetical protein
MINIPDLVQKLLAQTKSALLEIVTTDTPLVIDAVDSYISNAETRMSSLLQNLSEGGDVKFLLDRLREEKDILRTEVLSFIVIGKGVAQNVINSVQDILLQAIASVLPPNNVA